MSVFLSFASSNMHASILIDVDLMTMMQIDDYDLVTSRNNLGKLFSWIIGSEDTWRIDTEVMNNKNKTVFFRRRDLPKMQSDNEAAAFVWNSFLLFSSASTDRFLQFGV